MVQTDSIATDSISESIKWSREILTIADWTLTPKAILCIIALLYGAMMLHMLFSIFVIPRFYHSLSLQKEEQRRVRKGLPPMSDRDKYICYDRLAKMANSWTHITTEDGDKVAMITEYRQIYNFYRGLALIAATHPDDKEIISYYNDNYNNYLNALHRIFMGSKMYCIISAAVAVLLFLSNDFNIIPLIAFPCFILLYYLSTLTPRYLLNKRAIKGAHRYSFVERTLMHMSAFTDYVDGSYTHYEYEDGTTYNKHNTEASCLIRIIHCILAIILCCLIPIVVLVNYIRNYIIHI